jgi:hypothetical protein
MASCCLRFLLVRKAHQQVSASASALHLFDRYVCTPYVCMHLNLVQALLSPTRSPITSLPLASMSGTRYRSLLLHDSTYQRCPKSLATLAHQQVPRVFAVGWPVSRGTCSDRNAEKWGWRMMTAFLNRSNLQKQITSSGSSKNPALTCEAKGQ